MKVFLMMWRMSKTDLRLLWFAMKHPARPGWLLPAAIALGVYAIAPWNIAVPALGIVDDFVLVPLVLHALLQLLPHPVRQGFDGEAAPGYRTRR